MGKICISLGLQGGDGEDGGDAQRDPGRGGAPGERAIDGELRTEMVDLLSQKLNQDMKTMKTAGV